MCSPRHRRSESHPRRQEHQSCSGTKSDWSSQSYRDPACQVKSSRPNITSELTNQHIEDTLSAAVLRIPCNTPSKEGLTALESIRAGALDYVNERAWIEEDLQNDDIRMGYRKTWLCTYHRHVCQHGCSLRAAIDTGVVLSAQRA